LFVGTFLQLRLPHDDSEWRDLPQAKKVQLYLLPRTTCVPGRLNIQLGFPRELAGWIQGKPSAAEEFQGLISTLGLVLLILTLMISTEGLGKGIGQSPSFVDEIMTQKQ
jgi:hypothetical protein